MMLNKSVPDYLSICLDICLQILLHQKMQTRHAFVLQLPNAVSCHLLNLNQRYRALSVIQSKREHLSIHNFFACIITNEGIVSCSVPTAALSSGEV